MSSFLWKLAGCTNSIRILEYTLRPVFSIDKWLKAMRFARGGRGLGPTSNGPQWRQPNHNHEDYEYNYDWWSSRTTSRSSAEPPRWPPQQLHPQNMPVPGRHMEPLSMTSNMDLLENSVNANCGELRLRDVGTMVLIKGRVQFQRLNRFIRLRDSHGTIQLVALEERLDLIKRICNIPLDSHIEIVGIVQRRPKKTVNTTMATGEIEVRIEDILDVAASKRKLHELSGEEAPGRTGKKARSSILITSAELNFCATLAIKKKFLERTHNCGQLNAADVNTDVTLCGWLDSIRTDRFFTMRDGYGAVQLVVNPIDIMPHKVMKDVKVNMLMVVKGKVLLRPAHQRNPRMATGTVEVKVNSVELINPNEPEPASGEKDENEDKMETEESSNGTGPPPGDVNSYVCRSHTCGQLRASDVGTEVSLCGWLDSQRGSRFGTIRDGHGKTQILISSELEATVGKKMAQAPLESVIKVAGTVCARPPEQISQNQDTGEIEVVVKEFTLLNPAKKDLPFIIRDHNKPKEPLRMKYRYLDLRFAEMQQRLRLRSCVLMKMREFLINQRGFVEVETPTLFRRTPGGAQEYVVPTRTKDKFYSLVQSPQQLKQLLMVGAMDRYFQVARCYRDEGARPDRQPEFTQMDIELSFTDREGIRSLIEELLQASWPEELKTLQLPFPTLTYQEAMHLYGSDKPDLSFGNKLVDIGHLITEEKKASLPVNFKDINNFTAKALFFSQNHLYKLKETFQGCEKLVKEKAQDKVKLIQVKCSATKCDQELAKALPFFDVQNLKETLQFQPPGAVVVGIGKESDVLPLMGKLRQDVLSSPTSDYHFAWIVDFPLFLEGDDGKLESAHHPFTMPHENDINLLDSDPLKVRGLHFDLVLNGHEVGGGSVRIHDAGLQTKVLKDILDIPTDSLEHLLEALRSGAPPHGGIALGVDRLLSIMTGTESIRDVIAFPKGFDGKDPLSGAPCDISAEEKEMYHLIPKS